MAKYTRDTHLSHAFGYPFVNSTQVVAFTGTAANITLDSETMYRFVSTEDCHLAFSHVNSGVAADTSDCYLPAGTVEYFATDDTMRYLSVIRNATSGNLYVTPMEPVPGAIDLV